MPRVFFRSKYVLKLMNITHIHVIRFVSKPCDCCYGSLKYRESVCLQTWSASGKHIQSTDHSRLGDVVVSVLATGPKGCGFEPGQGDGFLRAIKIRSVRSFEWEVKPEVPCRKILRHVKDLVMSHGNKLNFHFLLLPPTSIRDVSDGRKPDSTGGCNGDASADRTAWQYWGLPERSGRQVRN
jgi:hypothetical protein